MVDLIPEQTVKLFLDNYNRLADSNGILATSSLGNLLRSVDSDIDIDIVECSFLVIRAVGENPTKEELQDFINMIDKEATGFIKFPDFLFMMASKVFLFFKNSNVVFIEIIFQLDADLEEQDIREAFAIFDNVRKRLL